VEERNETIVTAFIAYFKSHIADEASSIVIKRIQAALLLDIGKFLLRRRLFFCQHNLHFILHGLDGKSLRKLLLKHCVALHGLLLVTCASLAGMTAESQKMMRQQNQSNSFLDIHHEPMRQ